MSKQAMKNALKQGCVKWLLTACLLLWLPLSVAAQRYVPNTKWPYIYENFQKGVIYVEGNQKGAMELNVHLLGNVLHYIKPDGRIYQSDEKNVIRVEIGSDVYIFSDRLLMKIVAQEGTNLLLKHVKADFDAMESGSGAYGASLNSSAAHDLSSLDLGGLNNPELGKMLQEKRDGREIPVSEHYYFIVNDVRINANKKDVEKFVGEGRAAELKKFLKENKIKWKNAESLAQLLKFLAH